MESLILPPLQRHYYYNIYRGMDQVMGCMAHDSNNYSAFNSLSSHICRTVIVTLATVVTILPIW